MGLDSFACIGVAETLQGDDTRDSFSACRGFTERRFTRGRALFADSGCIHCHAISNLNLANGMPELAQQAPQFQGIGSRLNKDWIARWVANPKHLRPSARMPSLLGLESAESA